MFRIIKRILGYFFLIFLFAGSFFYFDYVNSPNGQLVPPPVKMLFPSQYGLVCEGNVCVDNPNRIKEAVEAYKTGIDDLARLGVSLRYYNPRFVFCEGSACFNEFNAVSGRENARTRGGNYSFFGAFAAPDSWKREVVLHELIHQAQYQRFPVKAFFMPDWVIEGMAYHHSKSDPIKTPKDLQPAREKYNAWAGEMSLSEALDGIDVWSKDNVKYDWRRVF